MPGLLGITLCSRRLTSTSYSQRKSSSHEKEYVAKGHLELKGKTITISVLSENIYKAVDELVEKLDRGLRRRSRLRRVKRKQISLQDLPYAA